MPDECLVLIGREHLMSYYELVKTYESVPKSALRGIVHSVLQRQQGSSHLLQGLSTLLGAGSNQISSGLIADLVILSCCYQHL